MTRKRFVKRLMSHGISRNRANSVAKQVIGAGQSYEDGIFTAIVQEYGVSEETVVAIAKEIITVSAKVAEAIANALVVVAEAITAAAPQIIERMNQLQQAEEIATE